RTARPITRVALPIAANRRRPVRDLADSSVIGVLRSPALVPSCGRGANQLGSTRLPHAAHGLVSNCPNATLPKTAATSQYGAPWHERTRRVAVRACSSQGSRREPP